MTTETRTLRLIYPEVQEVSESTVRSWAADLWADSAPRNRCCGCGTVTVAEHLDVPMATVRTGEYLASDPQHPCECAADSEPMTDEPRPLYLDDCCDYLEDAGVVTFSRSL